MATYLEVMNKPINYKFLKDFTKETPESSRLEFLEKFFWNILALSKAEDNTSGPLNIGGIADLPLLRTILVICQKSQKPSFWEVLVDSLVLMG